MCEIENPQWEIQEVPFGRVYRWHPMAVRCECGATMTTRFCSCGADHGVLMEKRARAFWEDDSLCHPWHAAAPTRDAIPY